MTLRVAVQMDPIETLNIAGDSTFALMLEAERRGHVANLLLRGGLVSPTAVPPRS